MRPEVQKPHSCSHSWSHCPSPDRAHWRLLGFPWLNHSPVPGGLPRWRPVGASLDSICFISVGQVDHLAVRCALHSFTSQRATPNSGGHSAHTLQTNHDTVFQRDRPPQVWVRGRASHGGSRHAPTQNLQGEGLTEPRTSLSLLPIPSLNMQLITYLHILNNIYSCYADISFMPKYT